MDEIDFADALCEITPSAHLSRNPAKWLYLDGMFTPEQLEQILAKWKEFRESSDV